MRIISASLGKIHKQSIIQIITSIIIIIIIIVIKRNICPVPVIDMVT